MSQEGEDNVKCTLILKQPLTLNIGEKRHVYQYIKSVLSFLKWKKTNNKSNAVKEKYKVSLLLNK